MDELADKQSQGPGEPGDQADKEPRCDPKQLELLKKCSEKRDMAEWNNWRSVWPEKEIWLEGAHLSNVHLEGVNLSKAYLKGADLFEAHLEGTDFSHAHLEGTLLPQAHLEGAYLFGVYLIGADLIEAHLEKAKFNESHLEGAFLTGAHLEGAVFWDANLEQAHLNYVHLQRAYFEGAHLEGAHFRASVVDGSTLFSRCSIDRKTDFRGVGLESCRIDEGTRYLLEYNRRRMNCEDSYKDHPVLAWPAKAFFWMSDYGRSTGRIIFTFFALAFIFAGIYYLCALVNSPGIVSNLFEGKEGPVPGWLVPFRTIYFSIVTMTTLGFGDMHANCQSFWGHLLLTVQVILGYVLLGALVTRFGVLLTSGVTPGRFKQQKNVQDKARRRLQINHSATAISCL